MPDVKRGPGGAGETSRSGFRETGPEPRLVIRANHDSSLPWRVCVRATGMEIAAFFVRTHAKDFIDEHERAWNRTAGV